MKLVLLFVLFVAPIFAFHAEIKAGDDKLIHKLYSAGITIGKLDDEKWEVFTNDIAKLAAITPYRVVRHSRSPPDMSHYTSYYALMGFCTKMQKMYPHLAEKFVVGRSVQNRELLGMRIRKLPKRKKIKLVGNMHGDETVGRELLIRLIEYILENANEINIKKILDVAEIHIVPSMNPDGFALNRRTNALGYDLNRNFPDQFYGQITPMQPETRAIIEWSKRENFTLSANFHGGDLVANYPFDGNRQRKSGVESRTKDDALFKRLAHAYADKHRQMRVSRRFPGGVTNGAKWYVLYGGMQDWNYLHTNDKEITLEVSMTKRPSGMELHSYWEQNRDALLNFMNQIHLFQ